MYAAADFMDPMIENGAKNIWSNVKSPTLFGSPKLSAGNYFQNFFKNIPVRRIKVQILLILAIFYLKIELEHSSLVDEI